MTLRLICVVVVNSKNRTWTVMIGMVLLMVVDDTSGCHHCHQVTAHGQPYDLDNLQGIRSSRAMWCLW